MAEFQLTEGAIAILSTGGYGGESDFKPVLQMADLRMVNPSTIVNERYRVLLSDGEFHHHAMLATQLNHLVKSGHLQKGSIIELTQFICNTVQNRKIIIMVDLRVIVNKCDLIGVMKPFPAEVDGNAASVARSSAPDKPMIQPAITAGNSPTYYTGSSISGSAPRPTMGVAGFAGPQVQPSGENFNGGAHSHSSTSPGNMNSGRYNPSNTSPVHPKPEAGSGYQRAPLNNYVRPPNTSYHQPSPIFANRGPVAKNEAHPRIIPIAALNPYQGRWTIKARVTAKSELRLYSNNRGDGKVFSFDLLDSDGGEIRVTCFNAVADQFYHQIETGRVYLISRGAVRPAQKTYNHLRNDNEIMLDNTSTVQPCYEDDKSIPQQQFHFRTINDIEGLDNTSVVDLIAIVSSISPPSSVMRKNGTETQKRTLQLRDMSGRSIELTMWGNFCDAEGQTLQTMCDTGLFPVLAVKACRVNDFNGKSVGTISSTQLLIEPDFPEVQILKTWFDSSGKNTPAISLSTGVARTDVRKTICQIKDENLGTNEKKPDWITVPATVQFIRADPFCYTACPLMNNGRQCNKKVINNGDGKWYCQKCENSFDDCDYRYLLQMRIQDHTGMEWVTVFQEIGQEIIGRSAKEMYHMKYEDQDEDKFNEVMHDVLFTKFMFKLKVQEEIVNDEPRVKSTVVKAEKYNPKTETKYLLNLATSKECDLGTLPSISEGMPTPVPTTGGSGLPAAAAQSMCSNVGRDGGNAGTSQYGNPYGGGSRYPSSDMYISCGSCGSSAHNSGNCPSLVTDGGNRATPGASGGGGGASGSGDCCYKCNQPGHWARDCPSVTNAPPAYGNYNNNNNSNNPTRGGECYKCGQPGHWANVCPVATNNAAPTPGRYGIAPKQI